MAPFLLHLIFHPGSPQARNIARTFHLALNGDAALPNLAVPTRLLPEDGTELPPEEYDLDEAERSVGSCPGFSKWWRVTNCSGELRIGGTTLAS